MTEAMYDAGFNSSGRFYEKSTSMLGMTPTRFRAGGAKELIRFAVGECSLGAILVASSEKGVASILIGDDPDTLVRDVQDRFPNAELIVNGTEYKWWTEPGRVEKLADGRRVAGKRIADVFPTWKNWTLVADNAEVAPGVRLLAAAGHTPGHSAFLVTSGKDQLMVSNDTMYVPALLAPHPDWQGAYDQDGPMAVATRRKLVDRVIADKMMICGAHFPFPGAGVFANDGNAYTFTPVVQS